MKTLKNTKFVVALVAMSLLLVSCGAKDEPTLEKKVVYSLIVELNEISTGQDYNELFDTEVSYQFPNGSYKTVPINFPGKIQDEALVVLAPTTLNVTITRKLKEGVDLSKQETYQVAYSSKVKLYVNNENGNNISVCSLSEIDEIEYIAAEIPNDYEEVDNFVFSINENGNIIQ